MPRPASTSLVLLHAARYVTTTRIMAKQRFSGALNAAQFPFLSSLQQRTVVQPGVDNAIRNATSFYGTSESADYGIPQILYCENVIPTGEGMTTVGFERVVDALPGADDFDQVITLRDADERTYMFAPAAGRNYIYTGNSGQWVSTNPIDAIGKAVSRAYVNGRTFICYAGLGIYEFDYTANTFSKLTLIGLLDAEVRGIGSSNNYLIAYDDITVYWSSLINPLDFVPSLTTGAGFSVPQDVKGRITAVIGTAGGFIIYTVKNAVAAVYTQNARAPFTFKEVSNAGGIQTYEQVTSDQNSGPQYAWTTGGMQRITTQGSEIFNAELNDYLAGRLWEYWDSFSKSLVQVPSGDLEFQVKVSYASSRYLIISYSYSSDGIYQYALLYDTALKRWGKVKIDHVDCFEYPSPSVFGTDLTYDDLASLSYSSLFLTSYDDLDTGVNEVQVSKRNLAFLSPNGAVDLMISDYNKVPNNGVMVFGKFQMTRARMATIQQLSMEAIFASGQPVIVTAIAAIDGKTLNVASRMQLLRDGLQVKQYARRLTGTNISFAMEGGFTLTSYILEMTNDGDR